jgi:RHS repeat-associated protein
MRFLPVTNHQSPITSHARYVYATHINVPDYVIKGATTYRVITDQLGSLRFVIDASTGVVAQRMDYDDWGNVLANTNPDFTPFGFAGGLYDSQTKLVRFGARDYDPETGRWTSKDPIGFGGGLSCVYAYAGNDPCDGKDSTGLGGPTNLGQGWSARVDQFNVSGQASYEIHIFDTTGQEVGVFGPDGWINKHGFTSPPDDIPEGVANRLKGINVDKLRRLGKLPPKGECSIKGDRYMPKEGSGGADTALGLVGLIPSLLDVVDASMRAEEAGISVWEQMLIDMGAIAPRNSGPAA